MLEDPGTGRGQVGRVGPEAYSRSCHGRCVSPLAHPVRGQPSCSPLISLVARPLVRMNTGDRAPRNTKPMIT